jgi:hypothetical protein
MTKFEQLLESRPSAALKEVKKFKRSSFWEHFTEQMEVSRLILIEKLKTCDVEDIHSVRARLVENERLMSIPDAMIENIKDTIALENDAKKVEGARKK